MILEWKYSYRELKPGSSNQYLDAGLDIRNHSAVDAIYIESVIPGDWGNPLIEALPKPLKKHEIKEFYTKGLDYDPELVSSMDLDRRKESVRQLTDFRTMLPFHRSLEDRMSESLREAYKNRRICLGEANRCYGEADSETSSVTGFSLLGFSGCGKTSAIHILTDHIPQVIRHYPGGGIVVQQIVYLTVTCASNSNFSTLYGAIGKAVDQALGLGNNFYEEYIEKARSLHEKLRRVKELVETYFIGIILFDEIQLLDFTGNRDNTYDSLLNLSNTTDVALGIIGTEEAYRKLFSKLYTGRRAGPLVAGNRYCESPEYCQLLLQQLYHYQWTDQKYQLTKSVAETFYKCTKGIIDLMVKLWMLIQTELLDSQDESVKLNGQFVEKTFNKHYQDLQPLLAAEQSLRVREKQIAWAVFGQNSLNDEEAQKQDAELIMSGSQDSFEDLVKEIINNVLSFTEEYSPSQIEKAVKQICKKQELTARTRVQVQKKVFEKLKEDKQKKEKSDLNLKKEMTAEELKDQVNKPYPLAL